jgi:oxygen-independent coproporphyrinogen-3 oxidase
MQVSLELLEKYNVAVPRYTSYPTVPFWKENLDSIKWKQTLKKQLKKFSKDKGISLYIHLPFCESLCTYCGCNKKITTQHSVEEEYLQTLIKEWKLYVQLMQEKPIIQELHLGGGTPTFFSPENLERLLTAIFTDAIIHEDYEFSFEGHPNNTTRDHLQVLFNLGFRRVSYGVQDLDTRVQQVINRIQPFENVASAVNNARAVGFTSVNFDLIYGLPLQNETSIQKTIEQSILLQPDRVAFYSYAHVPWTSKGQRLFDENDLPSTSTKMKLYQIGKMLFTKYGYNDIGMDHFASSNDSLYKAKLNGTLHRNFMGYTTKHTGILLGLGVSSISDVGTAYAQNVKTIHDYYKYIHNNQLAVNKGFFLDEEDVDFKNYILDIACKGKTVFQNKNLDTLLEYSFPELRKLAANNLIEWDTCGVGVTALGEHFIRNICKAFDLHLLKTEQLINKPLFSKAV